MISLLETGVALTAAVVTLITLAGALAPKPQPLRARIAQRRRR